MSAQLFRVGIEGTKKYSPPLELMRRGFGKPGGGPMPGKEAVVVSAGGLPII